MRILVLEGHASSNAGGAERTMRSFLEAIASDHEIHLAYMQAGEHVADPEQAALYASTTQMGLYPISLRTSTASARDLVNLTRLVKRHRIERIITHMVHVSPLLRGVKRFTGVPFSLYYKWVCSKPSAGAKSAWGNAGADRAAAVSGFVRDYWIRNGVRADWFVVVPEGIDVLEERSRKPTGTPTIGFAGRLVPEKGLVDLIEAMPLILARSPLTTLRIAGAYRSDAAGTAYKVEVEARIMALGIGEQVIFDGFVSPLDDWLRDRDLVIIPSTCDDAQPIVMMQSMAVATPVVATRVGGIPEVLVGDLADPLVPPGDPAALAYKTLAYLGDAGGRARIGAALRDRCLVRYSSPVHVASLTDALGLFGADSATLAA